MKKLIWFLIPLLSALFIGAAQDQSDRTHLVLKDHAIPKLAIPDFLGSGDAQKFMGAFNQTLWSDVEGSGRFDLVPKTSVPRFVPQQPSDFQTPPSAQPVTPRGRKQPEPAPTNGGGRWMKDWSS